MSRWLSLCAAELPDELGRWWTAANLRVPSADAGARFSQLVAGGSACGTGAGWCLVVNPWMCAEPNSG